MFVQAFVVAVVLAKLLRASIAIPHGNLGLAIIVHMRGKARDALARALVVASPYDVHQGRNFSTIDVISVID